MDKLFQDGEYERHNTKGRPMDKTKNKGNILETMEESLNKNKRIKEQ